MKLAFSAINWLQESRLSLKSFSTPAQSYLGLQALSIFGTLWQSLPCPPLSISAADGGRLGRQPRWARCGVGGWRAHTGSLAGTALPWTAAGGHITFPAHSDESGGSSQQHRRAKVAIMGQQKCYPLNRSCHSLPEGKVEKTGLWPLATMWHLLLWAEWKQV